MNRFKLIQSIKQPSDEKVVMLVLDGLGGLPVNGKTELEAANTPNLDSLAENSDTGLMNPIMPGITPGSGPGHLALFGYDPLEYIIGRGVLSALGVKFPIQHGDLAARVNFATIDSSLCGKNNFLFNSDIVNPCLVNAGICFQSTSSISIR